MPQQTPNREKKKPKTKRKLKEKKTLDPPPPTKKSLKVVPNQRQTLHSHTARI